MASPRFVFVLLAALLLQSPSSFAAKPEWVDNPGGKGHGHGKKSSESAPAAAQQSSVDVRIGFYFGEQQRTQVAQYYGAQQAKGKCPPGLAKKGNGCQPPGQAKKWGLGRPLPADVVQYPVPNEVLVRIGVPPAGHRYVRVANDILLIAVGSMMVVDAIEDLMRP